MIRDFTVPSRRKIKIGAIIAEFNPFHNGHAYIIDEAFRKTDCTHVLIIQSGNFTQRAEPAIIDKYTRAVCAVECGAAAVLEIPTAFATGNAEVFAKAGVQIAASFPFVSHLIFGAEETNLGLLKAIAYVQTANKIDFDKYIKQHIKQGISFENARIEVVKKLLPEIPSEIIASVMRGSNNILAIEYLKELNRLKSPIVPVPIMRVGGEHNDTALKNGFTSATSLRVALNDAVHFNNINITNFIPPETVPHTLKALASKPDLDLFGAIALFNTKTNDELAKIYNVNEELINLIENVKPTNFEDFKNNIPTKRFSVSRVARIALHSTLSITKTDIELLYKNNSLPYSNLLCIDESEDELMAILCANSITPVIVRGNKNAPTKNTYYKRLKEIDEKADRLYETVCNRAQKNKPVFWRA
ncbi:MAG: nucleotidyltransferase family protein [Christensenellaceae bacterium]|jgi:cytidyltransferase-like protein|nr:nucleotidyltransferase family protein [Christensenellaceae bacterium]